MATGTVLERKWKMFFHGSWLYEDVHPEVSGDARVGLEEGVDLFLAPQWRQYLSQGMIQIKSSSAEALKFLEGGLTRQQIIPVVIGLPPEKATPEQVLRRLALDYCWHPKWKETEETTARLEALLEELVAKPAGLLLRTHRPKWAMHLA